MNLLLKNIQKIRIEDFAYPLEDNRIAKFPIEPRDASKLLVYQQGQIESSMFKKLPDFLSPKSLLVYNNTKVIHARLLFFKETGAKIELFCLEPIHPADYAQNFQETTSCEWLCMVGNLKKWKQDALERDMVIKGRRVRLLAEKVGVEDNAQRIRFTWENLKANTPPLRFSDLLDAAGQLPIPPYLNREAVVSDEVSYQTVFNKIEGSVAAPTAGLHFTPEVLNEIDKKGIQRQEVTLHVGAGTFQPVTAKSMIGHHMHGEFISVTKQLIEDLMAYEGNITAVGTTSVRTLESVYWFGVHCLLHPESEKSEWVLDQWFAYETDGNANIDRISLKQSCQATLDYLTQTKSDTLNFTTKLLIAPGYTFRVVQSLVTNFHQPNSTLLLLVAAFVGADHWKDMYEFALNNKFRFLSYGDSSLLKR